jgi:hypothetical protein
MYAAEVVKFVRSNFLSPAIKDSNLLVIGENPIPRAGRCSDLFGVKVPENHMVLDM